MSAMKSSKRCKKCETEKPLDDFDPRSGSNGGRRSECKECRREQRRIHYRENAERIKTEAARYRAANVEKLKAYRQANSKRRQLTTAAWYRAHPEAKRQHDAKMRALHHEKYLVRQAKYYHANAQALKQRMYEYRFANPTKIREQSAASYARNRHKYLKKLKELRQADPERYRKRERVKGARRRAVQRNCPVGEMNSVRAFYEMVMTAERIACYWCKKNVGKKRRHVDHVVPLARGGSHSLFNLCCSCAKCNLKKNAKLPAEFTGQHELCFA